MLRATAAAPFVLAAPAIARADAAPLTLGVLTPLTGAGSFDGPRMLKSIQAVADEINAAGGVLGRPIKLIVEDDETNPDDAVRAAHKLVDVDRVPSIMGTWASAVTTAVAPVCWESKSVPRPPTSGADNDHQAAAPGLPDPHAAQHHYLQGDEARRVHAAGTGAKTDRDHARSAIPVRRMPTQDRQ